MNPAAWLAEAFAVWLATLVVYWGVFTVEGLRQRVGIWKAVAGSLLVFAILLAVPSAIYLALLTGISALIGGTVLHAPFLFGAIVMGAALLYGGIRLGYMHEEGMKKHFALFFGAMTLAWGAVGFAPVADLLAGR